MSRLTHASLFSGIGGAEIAADWAGWQNLFHCEINPFCRRVLEYHYPNSKSYEDITQTDFTPWRGKVTVLTGASPASRSRSPEEERERTMTATSGRRCFGQFGRYSPLGSLVRTLMESEAWYSPARRLKWQAEECFFERTTLYAQESGLPLKKSAEVLSVRDIPSRRLLFRLVPSVRPTGATGCGLLFTVQTQGLKRNGNGRTNRSLSPNATPRPTLAKAARENLLPTPTASDRFSGTTKKRKDGTSRESDLKHYIAHQRGRNSRLNPLFVEEMMGFPRGWTLSPFLNGEWKA